MGLQELSDLFEKNGLTLDGSALGEAVNLFCDRPLPEVREDASKEVWRCYAGFSGEEDLIYRWDTLGKHLAPALLAYIKDMGLEEIRHRKDEDKWWNSRERCGQ